MFRSWHVRIVAGNRAIRSLAGEGMTREERIENVAKVMFDMVHHVFNIHECGWPGWVSESQREEYRQIARWHVGVVERLERA